MTKLQATKLIVLSSLLASCQNTDFYSKQNLASSEAPGPSAGDDTDVGDDDRSGDGTDVNEDDDQEAIRDQFTQNSAEYANVDILWVVDNSGSMSEEQSSLATNFTTFINSFVDEDIDFQMGIVTTDARSGYCGVPVAGSLTSLNKAQVDADQTGFVNNFMSQIQVGINGSGYEKGLETSKCFFDSYASSWLRNDAHLAVIYVSDEEDQSSLAVSQYVSYLQGLKSNPTKVKAHIIADTINRQQASSGLTVGSLRYQDAANSTGGDIYDITSDFGLSLDELGQQIVNLSQSFTLSDTPVNGTLVVKVNGVESLDWTYDTGSNSIRFNDGHVPATGAQITADYLSN